MQTTTFGYMIIITFDLSDSTNVCERSTGLNVFFNLSFPSAITVVNICAGLSQEIIRTVHLRSPKCIKSYLQT